MINKNNHIVHSIGIFLLLVFFGSYTIFGASLTLNVVSGTGQDNDWNTGGVDVGTDCSQQGGTVAHTTKKGENLTVPLDNPLDPDGQISSIEVRVYAKADIDLSGLNEGVRVRILSGGTQGIDGSTDELTSSYAYYSHTFTTDPNTSGSWLWTAVNALEVGCRSIASGKTDFSQIDVDHIEVVITYNELPNITGITGEDVLSSTECFQQTGGTNLVEINYRVYDADHTTVTVTVEYWNGSSWISATDSYLSGDKGTVNAQSSTTDRQILWNVANELGNLEVSNYNVRVTATDAASGSDNISLSSNNLVIDTKDPSGYGCSSPTDAATPGPGNVTLEASTATDASTIFYYFEVDDNASYTSPDASDWQEEDKTWIASGMVAGQTYYWHVKTKDQYGNETSFASSYSLTVSNVKPTFTLNSLTHSTNGIGTITVNYNLDDPQAPENCKILIEFSIDNGSSWKQAYISSASVGSVDNTGVSSGSSTGQIQSIATNVSSGNFVWDSKNSGNEGGSLNTNEYANTLIRVTPEDNSANSGETVNSNSFTLDNKVPTGYGCSSPTDMATNISLVPTLTSTLANDMSSFEYYFELDDESTFATVLQYSGWQEGETWQPPSQLLANTTYYWHVKIKDQYGNEGAYQTTYQFSTSSSLWSYPSSGTIGACSAPCLGDGVVYVGTGGTDDKLYCLNITDGSLKWYYQASGDISSAVCHYYSSQAKYAVYFTTSDAKLYALWDDGNESSVKFTNVDLGTKEISEPMIDIDGSYLYLGYWKTGEKRSATDGSLIWQTQTINPSPTSAAIVDNANVYFTSGSNTYKYTIDNTAQGSVSYGSSSPLGLWNGVIYIPAADNFVYAINISNMGTTWTSTDLGAVTNTAVMYTTSGVAYLGAGNNLKAISTTDGTESGSYTAGNTINSMPITNTSETAIFFGCDDSKAYGITTSYQNISGWPKNVGGAIQKIPAVDEVNGIVVFCSNEGKVYGFSLP